MRKSSWVILGICFVMLFGLGFAYIASQQSPQTLTREDGEKIIKTMQEAVAHKNTGKIMDYVDIAPGTKVGGINADQLRVMIARALHQMEQPRADTTNFAFSGGTGEAKIEFDLTVHSDGPDKDSVPYTGHITLNLKRVEVPHLLGLYQTKEWRIVGGDPGRDLSTLGDW